MRVRPLDIRLMAATHRDLPARIREGAFREDLYYRLSIFEIRIPSLRERPEDIPALCERLLADIAHESGTPPPSVSGQAMDALQRRPWPGNIRQLRSVLERAVTSFRSVRLELEHLSAPTGNRTQAHGLGNHAPWPEIIIYRPLSAVFRGVFAKQPNPVWTGVDTKGHEKTPDRP